MRDRMNSIINVVVHFVKKKNINVYKFVKKIQINF